MNERALAVSLAVLFSSVILVSYNLKGRATTAEAPSGTTAGRDDHLRTGLSLHQQGRLDEALKSYEAAALADPQSALAYYNIGTVHYQKKNFAAAIDAYVRAVAIDPRLADAQFNLGYTRLYRMNDAAGAIEPLQQAIAANPQMAKAFFELGNAYRATGTGDPEALWKIAITLDPRLRDAVAAQRTTPTPPPPPRR